MSEEHSTYSIALSSAADRQLRRLPRDILARVRGAIDALAREPRPSGVVKLSGVSHEGTPLYRVRVGDYRVVYAIQDEQLVVLIVAVGDRKEVYR